MEDPNNNSKNNNKESDIEVNNADLLYDGFGNSHPRQCPSCGNLSMYIALRNDFRCSLCYEEVYVSVGFN